MSGKPVSNVTSITPVDSVAECRQEVIIPCFNPRSVGGIVLLEVKRFDQVCLIVTLVTTKLK